MKEFLSSQDIKFAYLDISQSIGNLKRFLKYRDNHDAFKEVKEHGYVGIPCVVINDGEEIYFDSSDLDVEALKMQK